VTKTMIPGRQLRRPWRPGPGLGRRVSERGLHRRVSLRTGGTGRAAETPVPPCELVTARPGSITRTIPATQSQVAVRVRLRLLWSNISGICPFQNDENDSFHNSAGTVLDIFKKIEKNPINIITLIVIFVISIFSFKCIVQWDTWTFRNTSLSKKGTIQQVFLLQEMVQDFIGAIPYSEESNSWCMKYHAQRQSASAMEQWRSRNRLDGPEFTANHEMNSYADVNSSACIQEHLNVRGDIHHSRCGTLGGPDEAHSAVPYFARADNLSIPVAHHAFEWKKQTPHPRPRLVKSGSVDDFLADDHSRSCSVSDFLTVLGSSHPPTVHGTSTVNQSVSTTEAASPRPSSEPLFSDASAGFSVPAAQAGGNTKPARGAPAPSTARPRPRPAARRPPPAANPAADGDASAAATATAAAADEDAEERARRRREQNRAAQRRYRERSSYREFQAFSRRLAAATAAAAAAAGGGICAGL
jgi:hypothetical protein